MLRGPIEYVPPAAVEVMLKRQAIPLDENEGIYVRDIKSGKVIHSFHEYTHRQLLQILNSDISANRSFHVV